MSDNWRNESQDKDKQGGQQDSSKQQPGQGGQTGQTDQKGQNQQPSQGNPPQSEHGQPQKKAS